MRGSSHGIWTATAGWSCSSWRASTDRQTHAQHLSPLVKTAMAWALIGELPDRFCALNLVTILLGGNSSTAMTSEPSRSYSDTSMFARRTTRTARRGSPAREKPGRSPAERPTGNQTRTATSRL
jgi:hypothetical protein